MTTSTTQPTVSAEFAGGVRELFLQSLEREFSITQTVISRVPEPKRDWKPEPVSRSAWELATHLAKVDVWFLRSIAAGKFEPEPKEDPAPNVAALASWYEVQMKDAIARVRRMTPEQLLRTIDFYGVFNLPAFSYLEFCLKHSIHHRAQLGTYLRPLGAKVPNIYGGSADEPWEG